MLGVSRGLTTLKRLEFSVTLLVAISAAFLIIYWGSNWLVFWLAEVLNLYPRRLTLQEVGRGGECNSLFRVFENKFVMMNCSEREVLFSFSFTRQTCAHSEPNILDQY